jgi:MarR family transcriptional repressor of emrRAB
MMKGAVEIRQTRIKRTANLLGALALELTGRAERQARRHPNETASAMAALNVIGFLEGCSNNALARALGLSHTATVRLVDKLEALGLVTSEPGDDRRSVALSLTSKGRSRGREAVSARRHHIRNVLAILPDEDMEHLTRISELLLKSLVTTTGDAEHICRLCDTKSCPQDECPVHERATTTGAAANT